MSKSRKHLILGLGLGLAIGVTACADSGDSDADLPFDDEANADERPSPIAEVERDGNKVRFYEPEPGYIVTVADYKKGSPALAELRNKSSVEIYETLAGSSAPELLRAAFQRVQQRGAATGKPVFELPDVATAGNGDKAALTAGQFQSKYCEEFSPQVCVTERNVNQEWGIYRTGFLYGVVNPRVGNVGLQVRMYKVIGGWRNIVKEDVVEGREARFGGEGGPVVRRDHKIKVEYVEPSDRYHLFFTW